MDNQAELGVISMKVPPSWRRCRGRGGGGFDCRGYNSDHNEVVELHPEARMALCECVTNPKDKEGH